MLGRLARSWSWGQQQFAPIGLKRKSIDTSVVPSKIPRTASGVPVKPCGDARSLRDPVKQHGGARSSGVPVTRPGGLLGTRAAGNIHSHVALGSSPASRRPDPASARKATPQSSHIAAKSEPKRPGQKILKLGARTRALSALRPGGKSSGRSALAGKPLDKRRCGLLGIGVSRSGAAPGVAGTPRRASLAVSSQAKADTTRSASSQAKAGTARLPRRPRPPGACSKAQATSPGPVEETAAEHAARHPAPTAPIKTCARCVYNTSRADLERGYGSYAHNVDSHVRRHVWLASRPPRLGGLWGVGCVFCAHYRQVRGEANDDARREGRQRNKNARRGPGNADTKWSRFEVQAPAQIAPRGVRQHAESLQHRRAVRAFFVPAAAVIYESETVDGDRELFRGGVPQVEDWVRAWRVCRTPQSFAAAEAHGTTENFIKGSRVPGVSARAFQTLVHVMCFALRLRKRAALRQAKACLLYTSPSPRD